VKAAEKLIFDSRCKAGLDLSGKQQAFVIVIADRQTLKVILRTRLIPSNHQFLTLVDLVLHPVPASVPRNVPAV
jgi:hypothetical protein